MTLPLRIAAGLFAALAIALLFFLLREDGIPAGAANGTYAHDCCGRIVLEDGRMTLGETKTVAYALERDEGGPYLLPDTFVGTWEHRGFEIDGTREPVKLRLDALPGTTRITLPAATGEYVFANRTRKAGLPAR
jgi:hypothetical protein